MVDSPEEVRDDPMSSKTKINGVEPPKTMSALVPPEFIKLGSEADAKDALEPIYDQLSIAKWWWILELLPMKKRYQRHDKSWSTWLSINFGGPRVIHGQKRFGVLVHRTVQYRMQQLGYKPRAELLAEPGPTWKLNMLPSSSTPTNEHCESFIPAHDKEEFFFQDLGALGISH
ncbi:hypothetical protein AG1IA_07487 [Rhizoctonia solani AG-1 IA]|uniref:Uncharacterized protein n=1 Tax=Thanatephorus cucumeris (strain AG1-IA) TaxID=983506 RepID=L8WKN7_THACA|nr:hypothetical protein AG1IA_07487 [Rhizoctonia solani AG-1 IA]